MIVLAINNGDWFSTSTWDSATVPTANDDVYLNGYNLTANNTIHFNTLSNRSAEDINEGGKITFSSFSGNILCQGGDIYATNNIFTWGQWTATVEANKIYSYTPYTVSQQRAYSTFYSTGTSTQYSVLLYITANKIITDENSVGMLVISAYSAAAYRTLVINADIEHNGGFISDTLSAFGASGLLNGNVVCGTNLFSVTFVNNHLPGRYCTINGNILCMDFEEPFSCNSNYFNGDLTFNGNGNYDLTLNIQSFNGDVTYNGGGLLSIAGVYYGNIYNNSTNNTYGAAWGTCTINNYYDNSTSTYFSNLATTVNMTLTGEFHYNYHQAFTNNAYYTGFRKITTLDNGKIYIKGNNNYLLSTYLEINNPDRFAYNFVDITPNWLIIPYDSSPNVYPAESNVKKDVTYAYGQMVGTYDINQYLPPESVVLKDYEYGDSDDRKTGTMEQEVNVEVGCVTPEDVRKDVPLVGMGVVGSLVVPSVDDVRDGVVFDNGSVGTLIVQGGGDRLRIADFGYYTRSTSITYIVDLTESDKPAFADCEEIVLRSLFPTLDLNNIPDKFFDDLFIQFLRYRLLVEYYRGTSINSKFTPSEPTTEIVNYANTKCEYWLNTANLFLQRWGEKYPNSVKKDRILL